MTKIPIVNVARVSAKGDPLFQRVSRSGLKPVEKKQVKSIAKKLDNAARQINEKWHCSPVDAGTGPAYSNYVFPGIPSQTASLVNLFPEIQQGTSREKREGSRIDLKGVKCRFFFQIPAHSTANDSALVACRLLVLSSKTLKQFSKLNANWDALSLLNRKYLRDGSTETAFQGDMKSLNFSVNTAHFTTHYDKRFTLARGEMLGNDAQGFGHAPSSYKILNIRLKVKSVNPRWPDDTETENVSFAPFAILMYAPMSGGHTLGTGGYVEGNCVVHTTWKDMD